MSLGYGSIYVSGGSTGQNLTKDTPAKLTGFATNGANPNDQGDFSVVPTVASDKITVKGGGIYEVHFHVSGYFEDASVNDYPDLVVQLYRDPTVGATEAVGNGLKAQVAGGDDQALQHCNFCGIVEVTQAQGDTDLLVYGHIEYGDADSSEGDGILAFTPVEMNLFVKRIG